MVWGWKGVWKPFFACFGMCLYRGLVQWGSRGGYGSHEGSSGQQVLCSGRRGLWGNGGGRGGDNGVVMRMGPHKGAKALERIELSDAS